MRTYAKVALKFIDSLVLLWTNLELKYKCVVYLSAMFFLVSTFCDFIAGADDGVWWYIRIPMYSFELAAMFAVFCLFLERGFIKTVASIMIATCIGDGLDKLAHQLTWTILDTACCIFSVFLFLFNWRRGKFNSK